ncbi:molybdopterin molybdotransferase MoeA [Sneathiella litorea]|nr:gephyrin-like molybdotransferase Glp [Sneathiella litorea]
MKRLANDCFSNASEMISVAEALTKIAAAAKPLAGTERTTVFEAEGRILAEDIYATMSIPPTDNSAVDGYAFCFADYEKKPDKPRNITGQSKAGHPWKGPLATDAVIKILTGAVMPEGLDTIAMTEDVSIQGNQVILPTGLKAGDNCRKKGEDIQAGQILLTKGTQLRPQELGYLASVGLESINVFKRLKVALFSTGDELVNPGEPRSSNGIYDSNRLILIGLLANLGCSVTDLGILKDRLPVVRAALHEAASNHDLVLTSGGVSMGDEDHVKTALNDIGHLHFWRIAIKPGRPLALGQIGNTAFIGLPGNPIAALVCTLMFARPLIKILSGANTTPPLSFQATSDFSLKKKPGRTEWLRARYHVSDTGIGIVEKYPTEGSGILSSAVWANGLIEIGDDVTYINKGDLITFFPFSELMR